MESGLGFSLLLLLVTAVAAAWFALDHCCAPRLSPKEPPLLPHPVPYIGHILGLLRHGTRYYQMTSRRQRRCYHRSHPTSRHSPQTQRSICLSGRATLSLCAALEHSTGAVIHSMKIKDSWTCFGQYERNASSQASHRNADNLPGTSTTILNSS